MTGIIPVQGTWSFEVDPRSLARKLTRPVWWKRNSRLAIELGKHDLHWYDPGDPFVWSTVLDGLPWMRTFETWRAAGWNLKQYVEGKRIAHEHGNYLTYSYGVMPMLFALNYGLRARNIVSVAPPLRQNVIDVLDPRTFERYDRWSIITEAGIDWIRELANIADGHKGIVRTHSRAELYAVWGIGHGGIIDDPQKLPLWTHYGWHRLFTESAKNQK